MAEFLIEIGGSLLGVYGIKRFVNVFFKYEEYLFPYPVLLYGIYWILNCISYKFFSSTMDFIINVGGIILILYSFHVKWESKVLVLVLILEVYIMVDAIIALISILLGKIVDQNLLNCLDNMFLLVFVLFLERIKFLNRGIEIPIQYSFIMLCVPITSVTISSCLMWSGNLTKWG